MENDIINLLLNYETFSESTSKPILYHTVKMAHSIHMGQKFKHYQAFESALEHYQIAESVQFNKRDSRTVQKAKPRLQKNLNEQVKYYQISRYCIHGGKNFKARGTGVR